MDKNTINTMLEIGEELGVEVEILRMDSKKFSLEWSSDSKWYKWDKDNLKRKDPFTK
jgi:hypothetical protein